MPKFIHTVEAEYKPSFRTQAVAGMFDVPVEQRLRRSWEVDMPIEDFDWDVGIIVGPSGAGKTTIGKKVFENGRYFDGKVGFEWNPDRSLLDDFASNLNVREITEALYQVGFSSPPTFMLPFDKLSNGQKFRTEMARLILEAEGLIVVDEFTSVVDRRVAKICSFAVQKLLRKEKKKMVAISCHDDIIEWLEPDWVYRVDTNTFTRGRLRRPKIDITIRRIHHSCWPIFRGHHYLSAELAKAAHCYGAFIDDAPVAFCAVMPQPNAHVRNLWRGHRTVVLPDFQGIGIGNMLSESIAQHYINNGKRFVSTTSHPAMVAHRNRSPKWKLRRKPSHTSKTGAKGEIASSADRLTVSFEYVAPKQDESLCQMLDTPESIKALQAL